MRCALLLVGLVACSSEYPRETTCTVGERRDCTCASGEPGFELCYDASPSIWGACVCDDLPIADAGGDLDVPVHTTVQLNARNSSDPNHLELRYHWSLDAVPAGSVAMLQGDTTPDATFVADVEGTYELTLVVDDADVASAPAHVTVRASNDAPVALGSVTRRVVTHSPATLDASGSTDANADPLTFAWSVVVRPPGSSALPADANAATTTFTPDVDGDYQLSVDVSDGKTTSTFTGTLTSYHPMTPLPGAVRAALYDRAHDRVIFIADGLDNLYVYTPATDSLAAVPLAHTPLTFAMSPDGTRAVLGDNSQGIVVVNLTTSAVVSRFAMTFGVSSIVDPGDGWAYVFDNGVTGSDPVVRGVRLSNGAVTLGPRLTYGLYAERRPATTTIYWTGNALTGTLTYASGAVTLGPGTSPLGTALSITDDGTRLFVLPTSVYAPDFTPLASLPRQEVAITESSATGKMLAIPSIFMNAAADESLDEYTYPALTFQQSMPLAERLRDGTPYASHARFVFLHADGVHYTVIIQAEPLFTGGEWVVASF